MKIKGVKPKEIFDSRGNPTVEVALETNKGVFIASVASGASKGSNEALELRDEDGKGVRRAINNVKKVIAKSSKGKEIKSQRDLDEILLQLDGTEKKSKLGVNAILPVSIACCRALAAEQKLPLYKYIAQLAGVRLPLKLPLPCFNFIEGGAHVRAQNSLAIQEFMIIPQKRYFRDNFKIASEIYGTLKNILIKNSNAKELQTGDEGGFAPAISKTEQALLLLSSAIEKHPDVKIGIDSAATHFYNGDKYIVDGQELTREGLLAFYKDIISRFPIIFIEDPFAENDWQGFKDIKKEMAGRIDILGDDLTTTNIKRIKEAHSKEACSGVIIKPNQIGTVSETIEAAGLAKSFGWKVLVSHRSGETMDNFIADLAVGIGADFIKSGAPLTKERIVKYNRLLEIESEL